MIKGAAIFFLILGLSALPLFLSAQEGREEGESEESELREEAETLAEEVETEKALKEQEMKIEAQKHYDAAVTAIRGKEYELAILELKSAVEKDPKNQQYLDSLRGAVGVYINELLKDRKFEEVIKIADEHLEKFPDHKEIVRFRDKAKIGLEKEKEKALAAGEEEVEPEEEVVEAEATDKQLLNEARALIRKKDYVEAKKTLEKAYRTNPFNLDTIRLLDLVNYHLRRYERARKQEQFTEMVHQVLRTWTKRPRTPEEVTVEIITPPEEKISPAREEILKKLEMIIPEVKFEDADIRKVIDYLREEADVNIVIDPVVFTGYAPTVPTVPTRPEFEEWGVPVEETGGPGTGSMRPPGGTGSMRAPGGMEPEMPEFAPGPTEVPIPPVVSEFRPLTEETAKITLTLKNAPLKYILRSVLRYKNLRYLVEDYAILIIPIGYAMPEELQTEIFRLSTTGLGVAAGLPSGATGAAFGTEGGGGIGGYGPAGVGGVSEFGGVGLGAEAEFGPGAAAQPQRVETIRDFLLKSGVSWPSGSNINYIPQTSTLIVRNTPSNLVLIRELVRHWDKPPLQVEIEARFVELQQTKAFENSFRIGLTEALRWYERTGKHWGTVPPTARGRYELFTAPSQVLRMITQEPAYAGGATDILSLQGRLTVPEFQVVWYALDQTKLADILSAPRVTTISGQPALIMVVQELRYATEYDIEDIDVQEYATVALEGMPPFIVVPSGWETRNVGIILAVTPTVSADGKVITLVLLPMVSALIGWETYGTPIPIGEEIFYPSRQPTFEVRTVNTRVYVNDGETIVLGGLIRENTVSVHDKVPILGSIPFIGRFFRSEYEVSEKRNLLIFVTAKLITSRGTELKEETRITEERAKYLEEYRRRKAAEETGETSEGAGFIGK